MNTDLIKNVEKYVYNYFLEHNTGNLIYHDINHTTGVVKSAERLGIGCGLSEKEMEILIISAWFHDLGYVHSIQNHEEESNKIAEKFLSENDYPPEKIEKVKSCILSTKGTTAPQNTLQAALCDADLLHLAKKSLLGQSKLLKLEFEKTKSEFHSEKEWYEETIKFMKEHEFYTKFAKEKYDDKKRNNILKLKNRINKILIKSKSDKLKEEKILIEKEKLKDKQQASARADRGIETMFRNVIRTHVQFSSMADNKAHIMISVNTLVLTAIIAVLARKLDTNPHLIIPTIVLTIVSLTTLVVATFVTRPKITDGVFTEEDIKNKKTNLLFFGNFYKMKLDTFTWGMKEMMKDKEFLYGNMIMDFYYLGQVLGRKYKFLNICYNIFIYGMIISVIVFAIAIYLTPEQTNIGTLID